MNSSKKLKILVESGKTVFKPKDLQILWQESELNAKTYAIRMLKGGLIIRPAKGYYALNENYSIYEAANAIITPSYVSFDSALFYFNVNFQARNDVVSAASLNYERKLDKTVYKYIALKKQLLFSLDGIISRNNVSIATPERAVLDSFYFGFLPNIDNFEKLNKTELKKLSLMYPKSTQKKVKELL